MEPIVIRHAGLKAQVNVVCDRNKLLTFLLIGVMQGSWRTYTILRSSHRM